MNNIKKLEDNSIVIHIRTGEIFSCDNLLPNYIPPPLSYYTNILNKNVYDTIYLVAEDTINPCINKLIELYPNIIYKKNTLEDDIRLILGATNLICSVGTFATNLSILNKNIKNIYLPEILKPYNPLSLHVSINNINIYGYDYTEYKKLLMPWNVKKNQKKIFLDYK